MFYPGSTEVGCIAVTKGLTDVAVHITCAFIPHPPWPLLISDVGLELEGTLINCSLL